MLKKYSLLIGLVVFVAILLSIDISKLAGFFLKVNLPLLLLAIAIAFFAVILKSVKWLEVIKAHNQKISMKNSLVYFLIGFCLSIFTPGRIGDLSRALYLGKEINSRALALSTVILDRLIDIGILLLIGFVSLVSFVLFFEKTIVSIEFVLILIFLFISGVVIFFNKNLIKLLFRHPFKILVPKKYQTRIGLSFENFYDSLEKARKNRLRLFSAILIGVLIWIVSVLYFFVLLLSLNIFSISFYFAFLVLPIIMLLEILPISFSGIGTRDAALIFLFSIYSVSAEQAVAVSIIYFFVYLLIASVGLVAFFRNPIALSLK